MKKRNISSKAKNIFSKLFIIAVPVINYFEQMHSTVQTLNIDNYFGILLIAGFIVGGRKLYLQEKEN